MAIIDGHEYVDLGLPSGVKWATCNIGASKPEEYGDYYAWGETKTKKEYTTANSITYYKNRKDISGSVRYDVARVKWGGGWRLPTIEEIAELASMCSITTSRRNGIDGCYVEGPNGNSIFFPFAGKRNSNILERVGCAAGYWGSSPKDTDCASSFEFYKDKPNRVCVGCWYRYYGLTVRPVIKQMIVIDMVMQILIDK